MGSIKVTSKRRGRSATGKDRLAGTRMLPSLIGMIDRWAKRNDATRSEAIRRLIEIGLASTKPQKQTSKKSAARASSMAARQIEGLEDQSATDEVRARRKRRLLKGPSEFRDMRKDHPSSKA
jgi:hypothetical protein